MTSMRFTIELEKEGRWVPIGELTHLPGLVGFGVTREEALAAVEEIASQMLEDEGVEDAEEDSQRRLPVRIPIGR